jgi:deoxycytidine triphosphate deaminase
MLTGPEIVEALRMPITGEADPLIIDPILDMRQVLGTKLELRMDNRIYRFRAGARNELSLDEPLMLNEYTDCVEIPYGKSWVLVPGESICVFTFEFIRMPASMVGIVALRSALTDLGIIANARTIEPGFQGHLMALLYNAGHSSIGLTPLMRILGLSIDMLHRKVNAQIASPPPQKHDSIVIAQGDFDSKLLRAFDATSSRMDTRR